MPWRDDDEALLRRLEDEAVLERLAAFVRRGQAPPHPRAAGLVACLRAREGGADAVARALAGDVAPLAKMLFPDRIAGLPAPLLHHLAVFHAGSARALASLAASARDRAVADDAVRASVASLAAWLALRDERRYLSELARSVVGSALPDGETVSAALATPEEAIDALGAEARAGARERGEPARLAFVALGRAGEACRAAGLDAKESAKIVARAERQRSAAADEALAPVLAEIGDARAKGQLEGATRALAKLEPVARWTGDDASVERFAVDQASPIAWEHYRAQRWPELRALLAAVDPLVDRLAARIERDPTELAYAGPCAQMIVFRAEMETDAARQIAVVERALALCPTHRNGRLVLANMLCDRAIRTATLRHARADVERAAADVARAESLWPAARRLDEAKQKVAEGRRRAAS